MTYSMKKKVAAVQLIRNIGIKNAAQKCGVSVSTLHKWYNDANILRQAGFLHVPDEFAEAHSQTATTACLLRALELLYDEQTYLLSKLKKKIEYDAKYPPRDTMRGVNLSLPASERRDS